MVSIRRIFIYTVFLLETVLPLSMEQGDDAQEKGLIVEPPWSISAPIGTSAEFHCLTSNADNTINWVKKTGNNDRGTVLVTQKDGKLVITSESDGKGSKLTINKITLEDGGTYECQVIGDNSKARKSAELTVKPVGEKCDNETTFIDTEPQTTTLHEGDTIVFNCKVVNMPGPEDCGVEWKHNGKTIASCEELRSADCNTQKYCMPGDFSLGDYGMRINDLTREDGGSYTCHVVCIRNQKDGHLTVLPRVPAKTASSSSSDQTPALLNGSSGWFVPVVAFIVVLVGIMLFVFLYRRRRNRGEQALGGEELQNLNEDCPAAQSQ